MTWSLALCPDDAKQESVMYGTEFGVVFPWRRVHVLHPYSRASIASAERGIICVYVCWSHI